MPKFKIVGKKEAKFFTYVEAEHATAAIMKVSKDIKNIVWLPFEDNALANGKDLMIGQPEEIK